MLGFGGFVFVSFIMLLLKNRNVEIIFLLLWGDFCDGGVCDEMIEEVGWDF